MSGKNRYERTKSLFVGIVCAVLFLASCALAIMAYTNKTPERKVYEAELKTIREQTKTKKDDLSKLTQEVSELEKQRDFVQQALTLYEEEMDPISGRVTQFQTEGATFYCFRDMATLKVNLEKSAANRGIIWPKDPVFDLNNNWISTSTYKTSMKDNMKLYKTPYCYRETVETGSKNVKYSFYVYYLDEKNNVYRQTFIFKIYIE